MVVQTVECLAHRYVLDPPDDLAADDFVDELVQLLTGYLKAPLPNSE